MTPSRHPVPPIPLVADEAAPPPLRAAMVEVSDVDLDRLRGACASVAVDVATRVEASRDWWPLGMVWATEGRIAATAAVVCRASSAVEVADVARVCHDAEIPLVAAGGRSGVLGGSVPVHGGVVLDLTALSGIAGIDETSMVADVAAGTFGDALEEELRSTYSLTVGHWPQSMALSTVGGWLACRGAGQMSTRYGKIEDIVAGLDVVLADGRQIRTGGAPHPATGPDLTQVFVGSEGTLGIITGARLRLHPVPTATRSAAWGFGGFADGLAVMRRVLQRGATPAVLRLHDDRESARDHGAPAGTHLLVCLDEGDPAIVDATIGLVRDEAVTAGATRLDDHLVSQWWARRNDVAALERLISLGYVVDTMEVSAHWSELDGVRRAICDAVSAVEATVSVSAHQSHSYITGGCLYVTFAGRPEPDRRTEYHRAAWEAAVRASLATGGSLSHHHGIGLVRSPYLREALGSAFDVLQALKTALDPRGILNPSKLGFDSPFGQAPEW